MTLIINRDILDQFLQLWYVSTLLLPPNFVLPSSSPKTLSFSRNTQTCPNKTMIPNSLTVGPPWNMNITFGTHFRTFPPLGFCEIMFVEREMSLAWRQWKWDSNPFPFSLALGNSSRTTKGKTWGILGNR